MPVTIGWLLVLDLFLVITGIVYLTARWRVNAFLALVMGSFVFGGLAFCISGNPPLLAVKNADGSVTDGLISVITQGFGGTLTGIGIVILFGVIIGHFLERSGAAYVMAEGLLRLVGRGRAPLAMGAAGYIISIPVFCDSGFVVLAALNRALAIEAGIPLPVMATALSMGLYSTHVMVPPTPGALAAAGNLGADIGLVIVFGLVVAIPTMLAGVVFAQKVVAKYNLAPKNAQAVAAPVARSAEKPTLLVSFLPIIVPVLLIALSSVANLESRPFGEGLIKRLLEFIGHPVVALGLGMFLAMLTVPKFSREIFGDWITDAIKNAAVILVITAAGGSLGAVIKASGLGDFLGRTMSEWNLGLLLPFLIAAAIKTAQGSSTVSMITTSAIIAPLLPVLGWTTHPAKALAVLAVAAGAMVVSHANDSYFWVVSQFSGMDVSTAYKTQTLGSLITGLTAIAVVLALWILVMP